MKSRWRSRSEWQTNVRTTGIPILLLCLAFHLPAQLTSPVLRLAGLINLPTMKRAVLDIAQNSSAQASQVMLAEEQREANLEVREIHAENGTVTLNVQGTESPVTLSLSDLPSRAERSSPGLALENSDLNIVLRLYQDFVGRTVLQSPFLPATTFTLKASVANQHEAALVLERAFAEKEIVTIADGSKFILVVPKSQAATATTHSSQIVSSASNSPASINPTDSPKALALPSNQASDLIPAGLIDFRGVEVRDVLKMYAELIGSNFDRRQALPPGNNKPVVLCSQTPLTKAELIYALDTLLSWQDIKVVPSSGGLVKAVPFFQAGR